MMTPGAQQHEGADSDTGPTASAMGSAPGPMVELPAHLGSPGRSCTFLGAATVALLVCLLALAAWSARRSAALTTARNTQRRGGSGLATFDAPVAQAQSDDAERTVRAWLRRSPDDGKARMELARLLGKRGDYLRCAEELRRVPDWWPAKGEARFLEGQAYRLIDRAREAETAWEACIAGDSRHRAPPRHFHAAARELVAYYVLEGRLDAARRTIWNAYDAAETADRPAILVMLMRVELERIAHDEAVAKLRRFVTADPADFEARRALAIEEQLTGQEAAADREIAACLAARPADPAVWRTRLEILHQQGDRDGIRAALTRLPPLADGDSEIWKYRGLAREWEGDLAGAAEAYGRATRLTPYEPEYLYRLSFVEGRLGRSEPAREHSRRSQELRQAYAQLHEAYLEYIKIFRQSGPDDAACRAVVGRLATLCAKLGWKHAADAWTLVGAGG